MKIELAEGWNSSGNHDSGYGGDEVKTLAGQVAGIADITTLRLLPPGMKIFAQDCLLGGTTLWVTKGIHQRWDSINASGELKAEAAPHLQFQFYHAGTRHGRWVSGHIWLSESYALTQTTRRGDWDRYEWATVGVSVTWDHQYHRWPAQFIQRVCNIQEQGAGKRGFKRRNSIGVIVPAEFRAVVAPVDPVGA